MIVSTLLLTTLVLGSTSAVKDVDLPDHRCDFMLRERARQNGLHMDTNGVVNRNGVRLGQVDNVLVPLARHHIIPYNILYDFLRAAIGRAREWMAIEEIGETYSFGQYLDGMVRERLSILTRDRSINRGIVQAAEQAARLTRELAQHRFDRTGQGQTPELTIIQAFFYWLPGNIVVGPAPIERIDDPGRGPDYRLLMIVQQNQGERASDILRALYHHMVAYRDRTQHYDLVEGDFRATTLRRIVELLTEVSTTSLYPFSSNDWESIMDPDTDIRRYRVRDPSTAPTTTHRNELRKKRVNAVFDKCEGDDKFKWDILDIISNYVVPMHPELVASRPR